MKPYHFGHNPYANTASAGGYFSTVNDFATIGRAILTSQLIPQSTTDRWFKPSGFVEDWSQGVGRPWEIFRFKVNGQTIDVYSKGGDCKLQQIGVAGLN